MSTIGVLSRYQLSCACSFSYVELLQFCVAILVSGQRIAFLYVRVGERPPSNAILPGGVRVQSEASTPLVHGGVFDMT